MMLRHLGEVKAAKNIYNAVAKVIQKNETVTFDLGGHASTMEMAQAIIAEMQNNSVSCKS